MPENKYIDELTELTSPERAADWIVVEDVSAGETKKIKYGTVCAGSETALTVTSLTLAAGATVSELSTDGTMAGNSDTAVPTEKAVVTYVGSIVSTDGTMAGNSDSVVPTEKAVVTYTGGARTMASLTLATGATLTEFSTDGTMAGNSDTVVPTEKAVVTYLGSYSTTATINTLVDRAGRVGRSNFTYNGDTTAFTVRLTGAAYWCKDKLCHWDSELTTMAISTPAAYTWYYLYLDYSAITEGTAVTATELVWSSTAPTYSNTYSQWMSGDDRCIFAVYTNFTPTNIYRFFHDGGDLVIGEESSTSLDWTDVATTTNWTDVTLEAPAFCTKVLVTFGFDPNDNVTGSTGYWRTNGSSAITGHEWGRCDADLYNSSQYWPGVPVITDSNQIIEVNKSAAGDHLVRVYTNGWYFPGGM